MKKGRDKDKIHRVCKSPSCLPIPPSGGYLLSDTFKSLFQRALL